MSLFSNKQMRIIFIYCVIIILVICGIITARHKQSSSENPADTSSITNEPPKSHQYLRPISGTTYYAIKLFPFSYTSLGGIKIDKGFRVLDKNNHPIDGLYAAGVDAGGLYGDTYPVWTSGHAFGWSSYSGRHAALQALQDKKLAK